MHQVNDNIQPYSIPRNLSNAIYTWRFSRTSYIDELIVNRYYRQHCDKIKITSIAQLIQLFLQFDHTTICQHTMNHINDAKSNEDFFESSIFMNESYPFYLQFYPINDDGELKVKIHLAAFPDHSNEVTFDFKLYIKQINVISVKTMTFKDNDNERHNIFEFNNI
eukprot:313176_1